MKKKIADLWCDALESGMYPQGKNCLESSQGYCCLGVLCVLAAEHGVNVKTDLYESNTVSKRISGETLDSQPNVMQWAGLHTDDGKLSDCMTLASINDEGFTFHQIAVTIRKHWRTL
jgi:hypothetical protein